jgi:AcrR family transcriptional regulator
MPKSNDKASTAVPGERRDSRGVQRRRRIFKSLHDCIIQKGYVKTTLADIAEGAGMSASHLLYYFKGKEAILEQYFEAVSVRFLEQITEFGKEPPRDRIRLIADFWFKGESGNKMEIGFMLECFGAAVHDDVLKVTKAEFDLHCKELLSEIFESEPSSFIPDSGDSAEIAYALMIGLRSAVYFDDDIELEGAHKLFVNTLNRMCGLK